MLGENVRNNVAIALDTLRANKMRSGLTILGVVLGVSTVMMMAAIVQGIKDQIVSTIEIAGPTTFYVVKVFSNTPVNPDRLPAWIRIRPDLREAEAWRIQTLPEVSYAAIWGQTQGRLEYKGVRTQSLLINGADDRFVEIQGGDLITGRWFTRSELVSGSAVVVLEEDAARKVFGAESVLDKQVRIGGRPMTVIGLYQKAGNIFEPPGQAIGAIIPYATLDHQFRLDKTNAVFIPVKPRKGVTAAQAQEAVTIALREIRGLRPADKNNFDMITQDQILDTFNKITGIFFLVMIVLSSVGLMVGGIGVMAIMMVSVTNRTREIGVRKAMGATQREILLQFLVEAATLTGIGGFLGIVVGLTLGRLVTAFMNIDAGIPVALTLIAVSVSVGIGIVFGMIPARRAARLDPIEALRYE
ncbi:MAG: ABC transporter permease [Gemmatimonadaceae bacterium]|nr:ABC transporter permease [Gemmatimonadaceae bacterium]